MMARRLLEPGQTTFIRVNEAGGLFSVGIVKPGESCLHIITRAEMDGLRLVADAPPVVVPPVVVVPPIIIPPKEPTVDVPNLFAIIERVAAASPLTAGQENCGRFTEACAIACHAADPRFGHLKKNPGQTQFNGHAVDALLFKDTGQAIDIIVGSKTDSPKPGWGVDIPRYSAADWLQPAGGEVPPVTPDPPKPPDVPQPTPTVLARVVELERKQREDRALYDETLTKLNGRVDELAKAIEHGAPAPDLSGYAKRGDPVTVRLKVFGSNVTARGTIDAQ